MLLELLGVDGATKLLLSPLLKVAGGEDEIMERVQTGISEFMALPLSEAQKKAKDVLPQLLSKFDVEVELNEVFGKRELCLVLSKKDEAQTACSQ